MKEIKIGYGSMPTAICNVESTRSLDHGSEAALSTVSTWMGDRLQTGEPYKGLDGAAVGPMLYSI
jgi:hypothetical protein